LEKGWKTERLKGQRQRGSLSTFQPSSLSAFSSSSSGSTPRLRADQCGAPGPVQAAGPLALLGVGDAGGGAGAFGISDHSE